MSNGPSVFANRLHIGVGSRALPVATARWKTGPWARWPNASWSARARSPNRWRRGRPPARNH